MHIIRDEVIWLITYKPTGEIRFCPHSTYKNILYGILYSECQMNNLYDIKSVTVNAVAIVEHHSLYGNRCPECGAYEECSCYDPPITNNCHIYNECDSHDDCESCDQYRK